MELFKYKPIIFRVYGEPQPFPKKEIVPRFGKGRIIVGYTMMARDYRTRTNPVTHKIEKYDRGYLARWKSHVQNMAKNWMEKNGATMFPRNYPVAIGTVFFITRSTSCKLDLPSQKPDWDNFEYAIRNALSGICYYDDNQPTWRLYPDGALWADNDNPPGVLIQIRDAYTIMDQIDAGRKAARELV